MAKSSTKSKQAGALEKCPTGIQGLDEIMGGGFPRGRPTLVCGSAGCGKTLLAIEFLVRGAIEHGEPGVLMSFEESAEELAQNVRSLGFDLDRLQQQNQLVIDQVRVERSEIEEAGEYDLDGLFIRLGYAIDSVGAKRVVLDTIETLFGGMSDHAVLRSELRRLFRWLKDRGVTAVITAERGEATLTRQGLEEYVSDCVILLDHRVIDQVSTRRLRVVKYRGTSHGTNEYPFLIDEAGFSVLPITSLRLEHEVSNDRLSTGVPQLDVMLGGQGVYRGSSVLLSGTAGTGKTSVVARFAHASCARGERCLFFAFEESPQQIVRNMRSIGTDLRPWIKKGLLKIVAGRPSFTGLEMHLAITHKQIRDFAPRMVIIDPISNLRDAGTLKDSGAMLTRLIDYLKGEQITGVFTYLISGGKSLEATDVDVSSIIDTWLVVRDLELGGERNRGIYVIKSRGTAHSNQVREFLLTDRGVELRDVYLGPDGVLIGSKRELQEGRERATANQEPRSRNDRQSLTPARKAGVSRRSTQGRRKPGVGP
jgi:circadian clock protein KaiC